MGYFDSVKNKPHDKTGPAVASANVTRLTLNGRDSLHPYARRVVEEELARLDLCRSTPSGQPPHWDETTYAVACNLLEIANSPWSGYTVSEAWSDLSARAPRDQNFDDRRIAQKWDSAQGKVGNESRPAPIDQATPEVTVLQVADLEPEVEEDFWGARDALTHIRTFAQARRVSPWAVLGITLARVVTATSHQVCLPPIVGGKASLNMFVGIVGTSGAGKGGAEAVAAEVIDVGHIVSHNVGSGEGIAHGYKRRVKGDLEWLDEEHAVLFSVPEIDSLTAQGDRKGATLMPQLRSGWTGEQLGFGYADPTKRVIVEAHEYRLCMVAGIQPARAAALIDDADGGTPQRFIWLPANDESAPDHAPAEPRPMTWRPPSLSRLVAIGGVRIPVCEEAKQTILENRLKTLRGQADGLNGHALLCRLKTAAALGLLDHRYEVSKKDWDLAGVIAQKSESVRGNVVQTLQARAAESNHARAEAEAKRAVHVAETTADAAVKRVCNGLLRKLRKVDGSLAVSELRRAVGSKDRGYFEEAVERLLGAGQIDVEETDKGARISAVNEGTA